MVCSRSATPFPRLRPIAFASVPRRIFFLDDAISRTVPGSTSPKTRVASLSQCVSPLLSSPLLSSSLLSSPHLCTLDEASGRTERLLRIAQFIPWVVLALAPVHQEYPLTHGMMHRGEYSSGRKFRGCCTKLQTRRERKYGSLLRSQRVIMSYTQCKRKNRLLADARGNVLVTPSVVLPLSFYFRSREFLGVRRLVDASLIRNLRTKLR